MDFSSFHFPTVLQINLLYLEYGACLIGGDWSFMLNWETHIIIGWWFDLVVFKEVVVNSIRGRALLGLLAQEFCWDCIFLRILEFYVKSFGVWNIHVNFGDMWFVIRIICTYVIKFWLILWRDEYVYLFYHMERKKKNPLPFLLKVWFGAWHELISSPAIQICLVLNIQSIELEIRSL